MTPNEFPELTAAQYRALLAAIRKEAFWNRALAFSNAACATVGLLLALLSIVRMLSK